jgi:cell division protein FtsQ
MDETFIVRPGNFLRPKRKPEDRGGERFQGILRKILRLASLSLVLLVFLIGGHGVYITLLDAHSFQMRRIDVVGCQKISRETLLSLMKIEGMPNLFTVRLTDIAKRIESHPWIDHVQLRKVFPDTMVVQVKERRPIAILQLEELYYIDSKGVIFSRVGDKDKYNYPFLTGLTRQALDKSPEETKNLIMTALELLTMTSTGKVSPLDDISEIHMEKNSGIRCFPQNQDLEVKMGWDSFGEKLKRLSVVWSDLGKRGYTAISIDCRDVKRIVVKRVPGRDR